jgi:gamma-glutamyltranspeptidase
MALQSGGGFDWQSRKRIEPQRSAVSSRAMIAGTSEPLAVHAGLEVLKHGGNAVDAALTTSLAQIALTAGATISYAGIMTAVYYDAASGRVYALDAGYNTVQNEKEPLTIPQMGEHSGRTGLKSYFPDVEPGPESRLTKETAAKLWAHIRQPDWPDTVVRLFTGKPAPGHSAGVLVVDDRGNVASIVHSINGMLWGATGIFVDGVSIPDSAAFQQGMIARVGPGVRLPETTNPLLVLKNGTPVLASSAVGSGLLETTVQNIINVLDFGMDPQTSVHTPNTRGSFIGTILNKPGKGEYEKETVASGEFPESVLEGVRARGQAIKIVSEYDQPGYWIGIQIDPESHKLRGATTPLLPALVEGY